MNADLAMVLMLLAAAVAMFAINKPRMDAVALMMPITMAVLPFTGVISTGVEVAGYGDSKIVRIVALFVIGSQLARAGVGRRLGDRLIMKAGRSDARLYVLLPSATIVALAASAAFLMPMASAGNTLAVTPGNYGFTDFVRVGVPSTAIAMVVSAPLVRWRLLP